MELKDAKIWFNAGGLKKAKILFDSISNGWIIMFYFKNKDYSKDIFYTSKRSDEPKSFKNINSAINTVKSIGFNELTIIELQK